MNRCRACLPACLVVTENILAMHKIIKFPQFLLFLLATAILFSTASASAAEKPRSGEEVLLDAYHKNLSRLETNSLGPPLLLESVERDNRAHVNIYGIFDYPFSRVADVLKVPANWCDIVFLHPNVKTCTYRERTDESLLTFYFGRKTYQPPEGRTEVIASFRNVSQHQGYLDIILDADQGPFGTKDHKMRFEAVPIDGGRTFVHVSYAYSDSAALHLAAKIYFATLGHGKVGFTVTGKDKDGNPEYIGGTRGAVERSAVRYYLAIQSFMNTVRYPEESRFSMRISEWHDLTTRYRKQLYDLEKQEYMTSKAKEHQNQITLQQLIGPKTK